MLGGVLIGGASRRMGSPKHLLTRAGRSLLARTAALLTPHVNEVVVLGAGTLPADAPLRRVADHEGAAGPLAGVAAGLAEAPGGLLVAACDLPRLTSDAVSWLIAQRTAGAVGIVPRTPDGRLQPLLGFYAADLLVPLTELLAAGERRAQCLADLPGVRTVDVPAALAPAWSNANTPEEWHGSPGAPGERGSQGKATGNGEEGTAR